jgi:hypothetical protein
MSFLTSRGPGVFPHQFLLTERKSFQDQLIFLGYLPELNLEDRQNRATIDNFPETF